MAHYRRLVGFSCILFVANVSLCSSDHLELASERVHGRHPPPADRIAGWFQASGDNRYTVLYMAWDYMGFKVDDGVMDGEFRFSFLPSQLMVGVETIPLFFFSSHR